MPNLWRQFEDLLPDSPLLLGTVATGLSVPWGLDFLPDGDAVVTERDSGRVLLLRGEQHRVVVAGTVEERVAQGEAGLLAIEGESHQEVVAP